MLGCEKDGANDQYGKRSLTVIGKPSGKWGQDGLVDQVCIPYTD